MDYDEAPWERTPLQQTDLLEFTQKFDNGLLASQHCCVGHEGNSCRFCMKLTVRDDSSGTLGNMT